MTTEHQWDCNQPDIYQITKYLLYWFNQLFISTYEKAQSFLPGGLFGLVEANAIVRKIGNIMNPDELSGIIGGERILKE